MTHLLGFLVALVVLVVAEGVARSAYVFREDLRTREEQWFEYSRDLGWERKPGYQGPVGGFERAFDSAGYYDIDSAQVSAAGRKILFLGDSNTFGWGAATADAFPQVVEKSVPGTSAINMGLVGGSSYQGRVGLERYLGVVEPAIVVVSYNFNDRRYVLDPSEADGPETFERTWRASSSLGATVERLVRVCYVCRAARRALVGIGMLKDDVLTRDVSALTPRVDEEHYRDNLIAIVETARNAGAEIVFLLLRDNPAETEYVNLGLESLQRGDIKDATAKLEAAVAQKNMFSHMARVYLSQAYRAEGREQEADDVLFDAVDRSLTGGRPMRLDRDYNRIMAEVASQYGVPIVDGASALDGNPAFFVDFCHFNAAGHRRVGELLGQEIAGILGRHHVSAAKPL
jgi:tetratricopeptide (TPR) repeat protein